MFSQRFINCCHFSGRRLRSWAQFSAQMFQLAEDLPILRIMILVIISVRGCWRNVVVELLVVYRCSNVAQGAL